LGRDAVGWRVLASSSAAVRGASATRVNVPVLMFMIAAAYIAAASQAHRIKSVLGLAGVGLAALAMALSEQGSRFG